MKYYAVIKGAAIEIVEGMMNNAVADGWTIVESTFTFNSPYYLVLAYREMTAAEVKVFRSKKCEKREAHEN